MRCKLSSFCHNDAVSDILWKGKNEIFRKKHFTSYVRPILFIQLNKFIVEIKPAFIKSRREAFVILIFH